MYKITEFLSLHRLNVSLHIFDIASITNDDAKNPDINTKEEKRGQKQAGHKCRQAKELKIVPLRKPKCLS